MPWEVRSEVAVHAVALDGGGAVPEWVQLLPAGRIAMRSGRGPFVLDDPAAVIDRSLKHAAGGQLLFDYDHQTDFGARDGVGGTARAAGWIVELKARDDGIWGRVEWTEAARQAIAAREYRFISPVFLASRKTGRVTALLRASLTNTPDIDLKAVASQAGGPLQALDKEVAMDELLQQLRQALGLPDDAQQDAVLASVKAAAEADTALAAIRRDLGLDDTAEAKAVATAVAAKAKAKGGTDDALKAVATAAGLAETASAQEVAKAVSALRQAQGGGGTPAAPDPSQYVPIAEHKALASRIAALEQAQAQDKAAAAVDAAIQAGKVTPAGRDWALAYAAKDPDGFAQFVASQPTIVRDGALVPGLTPPDGGQAGGLSPEEKAVCAAMGLSEDEYRKSRQQLEEKVQ